MNKTYLGLGSNVGDSLLIVKNGISTIDSNRSCTVTGRSSFYETTPYGNLNLSNFINCVIEVETEFESLELFDYTKALENELGRKQREHWGPREVDIDILLFNQDVINSGKLTVPHSDLINRDFVLIPLLEINDALIHPVSKKLLRDYLNTNMENHILKKLK